MATPEGQIQNAILDYLEIQKNLKKDGRFICRLNSVGVFDPRTGGFRRVPKFAPVGIADIMVIHNGYTVFLEVKTSKGRQSANQKEFERQIKEASAEYYVVRSIDDVKEIGL